MLDTVGPELQVVNKSEKAISLEANAYVVLTPDQEKEASSQLLPVNFSGLPKAGIFLFMPFHIAWNAAPIYLCFVRTYYLSNMQIAQFSPNLNLLSYAHASL